MPVSFARSGGSFRLGQGFEGTRLAPRLLALAYEALVPILLPEATRPLPLPQPPCDVPLFAAAVATAPYDYDMEVFANVPCADADGRPVRACLV